MKFSGGWQGTLRCPGAVQRMVAFGGQPVDFPETRYGGLKTMSTCLKYLQLSFCAYLEGLAACLVVGRCSCTTALHDAAAHHSKHIRHKAASLLSCSHLTLPSTCQANTTPNNSARRGQHNSADTQPPTSVLLAHHMSVPACASCTAVVAMTRPHPPTR